MGAKRKIVIIGGVAAGPKTAARARRLDPEAEITIVEKGRYTSYAGCGMPYYVSGKTKEFKDLLSTAYGVVRDADYFRSERAVTVLTVTEAKVIDRANKKVTVKNLDTGEESALEYDKLVIATGSSPITPPVEGLDLKQVFRLNHPTDALAVKEALNTNKITDIVVIGAGLIGLEALDAVFNPRLAVTLVEFRDQLLPGLLDPDMSALLYKRLEEKGLESRLSEKVLRLEGDAEGNVAKVVTDKGTIDANMVIVAVGVRPNVNLAKDAGLTIGATGAITVNEYMQTSDPDIYALGDCVENTHLISGKKVYAPMATYANRQGRVVGDNVTGGQSTYKGILSTGVMHALGYNVGRTGLGEQQARDLGYQVVTALNAAHDTTHYHPVSKKVLFKLIVDQETGKILGAQGIGAGEIAKRVDVVAAMMTYGGTVDDLLNIDLGYAPPFNTPIDFLTHTGNMIRNKKQGLAKTYTAKELKEKFDRGDDFVLVDVRTPKQYAAWHIEDPRVKLVTLGELRQRLDEIPRDKEIVTLCAMGIRSYEAARILEGAGFKNVKFMEGGMEGWPFDYD